jgi:hypothetical protein
MIYGFSLSDVLSLAVLWKAYLCLSIPSVDVLINALGLSSVFLFVHTMERHSYISKTMHLLHSLYVHLNDDQVKPIVLRVTTDRVLELSMKSTTYESWHDSFMLI